ncbi:MAG: hypothetical protein E6J34_17660, partial [Chloroflexi bacterium]
MLHQLAETSFLKEQMAYFNGFEKSSHDIERYAVPAAIAERDWSRFIHFMLLAINLRGMAEDLLRFLKPLARSGQVVAAMEVINRTADPLERSVAKAVIAGTLEPSSLLFQRLTQSLTFDLATLPLPADPFFAEQMAEKQLWGVVVVAQEFGMSAAEALSGILRERPDWNDAIWGSIAECHVKRRGALDPDFWEALRHVKSPDLLKSYLPEVLASEADVPNPEAVLALVEGLSRDLELNWLCRLSLLVALTRTSEEAAGDLWERWSVNGPIPWSMEIANRGGPFLRTLADQQIRALVEQVSDTETKTALCIASLVPERDPEIVCSIQEMIELLPPGIPQIRWKLRLVGTSHGLAEVEIRREVQSLSQSLLGLNYAVDLEDLCRFLDLFSTHLPLDLGDELKRVLRKADPNDLLQIIERVDNVSLLADLLENSYVYLSLFSMAESDALLFRSEFLTQIIPRLCVLAKDISYTRHASDLNAEEADKVRASTAEKLIDTNLPDLAEKVCRSISSRSLRHLTRLGLRIKTMQANNLGNLESLLETSATDECIQDEIIGLRSLLAPKSTPSHQMHVLLAPIGNQQSQYLALFRLSWRMLQSPNKGGSKRAECEILDQLVQAAGLVASDAQLVGMMPEVADLVASRSGRHALPEIREALERLLFLRPVSWALRREACEALLSRLLSVLSEHANKGPFWSGAAEVAKMIADLLKQVGNGSNSEVEERGLIPVLFAVMDRMPIPTLKRFLRDTEPERFLLLYRLNDKALAGVLDELAMQDAPDAVILETVFYLLSDRYPEIVPDFLSMQPAGLFRDRLCSALLRYGWLSADHAPEALGLIGDPAVRLRTEITLGLAFKNGSEDENAWLGSLASLSVLDLVDPQDPRNEPWLRKLWTIDPERSRPVLAWAALQALA